MALQAAANQRGYKLLADKANAKLGTHCKEELKWRARRGSNSRPMVS